MFQCFLRLQKNGCFFIFIYLYDNSYRSNNSKLHGISEPIPHVPRFLCVCQFHCCNGRLHPVAFDFILCLKRLWDSCRMRDIWTNISCDYLYAAFLLYGYIGSALNNPKNIIIIHQDCWLVCKTYGDILLRQIFSALPDVFEFHNQHAY